MKIIITCLFLMFLSFGLQAQPASTSQTDQDVARDYLIKKLKNLEKGISQKHPAHKALTLRLAHTHSLRAEHLASQKQDFSKQVARDAKASLSFYRAGMPSVKRKQPLLYANSLLRMAYIHRLINEKGKALSYLQEVAQMNLNSSITLRAQFNIANIYFEYHYYAKALNFFNKVLQKGDASTWFVRAYYRKIWSLHHLSRYQASMDTLESFLKSSQYQKLSLNPSDQKLKNKLEQEMPALYSNKQLTLKHLYFFYQWNKKQALDNMPKARNQRLYDLAQSLYRMGEASTSNQVWKYYLTKTLTIDQEIESYLFIIHNYFVIDAKGWLLKSGYPLVKKILDYKQKHALCSSLILCSDIQKQTRRYLQEMARAQASGKSFQEKRLELYQLYSSIYSSEFDMVVKTSFLAKDLKKYKISQDGFQKAAQILLKNMEENSSKNTDAKLIKKRKEDLERVSMLQLTVAEASKDEDSKQNAYDFYLKNGTDKNTRYQAQYQKAYFLYNKKQYQPSAEAFKVLALMDSKNLSEKIQKLVLQSAHLSLSALNFAQGKQKDQKMSEWALLFAQKFSDKEFLKIYHSAVFNRIKSLASDVDFSSYPIVSSPSKKISSAWQLLSFLDQAKMSPKNQINYYMNKLLLAKEFLKLKDMDQAISQLLQISSLSGHDKKVALTWKLWLAESRFDFVQVLNLVKKLNSKENEAYHLRLARLAELAHQNYVSYYETFLKKYPNSKQRSVVIEHLLEQVPSLTTKKSLLLKYASNFEKKPDRLSYWVLKLDQGSIETPFIKSFVSLAFMKDSILNQFYKRKEFLNKFDQYFTSVNKFKLNFSNSNRRLSRSIKNYVQKIQMLETKAQASVVNKDWLSQVVAFSKVQAEWVRFQQAILNLPAPKGLSEEEKVEYQALLQKQILPYKNRSQKLQTEIDKLLAQNFIQNYKQSLASSKEYQGLVQWEVSQLSPFVTNPDSKQELEKLLNLINTMKRQDKKNASLTDIKNIKQAYYQLQSNPFNKNMLTEVLKLEKSRDNRPAIFYLQGRIEQVNKAKNNRIKL